MPATYYTIATNTLSSATASVTFSSISGVFTDLVLVASVKADSTAFDAAMRFNSDTNSNYSFTSMNSTGSVAQSFRASNQTSMAVDRQASVRTTSFVVFVVNIMNYSNATTFKTALVRGSAPDDAVEALVGLYRSTSAITSVTFMNNTGANFAVGSTFTLYGISAA